MSNFLILGLPRSRTAWLANFMTTDGIFCSHEGLNGCETLTEYRNKFTVDSGDSNTGLALFDFEKSFYDFKIVIIDNSIDAAVEFAKKNFNADITGPMNCLKIRLLNMKGLHIPYHKINDELEAIWDYVTDKQFNEKRANMLIGFDVQVRDIYDADIDALIKLRQNTNDYFP